MVRPDADFIRRARQRAQDAVEKRFESFKHGCFLIG
jgi:hypothetical protein